MKLILVAAALLGLGLLGMAVKIWGKKDGEFAGTCASNSPFLNKE
ncbi:MAG: membrane or secreted protein, partial [Flavobacteriia bacterium]|nr:membrane or secreted protein [Flavobacteriia bacterium]